MPFFDVVCLNCKLIIPDVYFTGDKTTHKCVCGSKKFKKLPPRVAIHFRGSGWTKKEFNK